MQVFTKFPIAFYLVKKMAHHISFGKLISIKHRLSPGKIPLKERTCAYHGVRNDFSENFTCVLNGSTLTQICSDKIISLLTIFAISPITNVLQGSLNTIFPNKGTEQNTVPVDTGRKLNVLCTFNLRPVSTGGSYKLI